MVEVEFYGGPRDGEVVALPEGIHELKMAIPTRPSAVRWADDEVPSMRDPGYIEVRLPIRLTRNGYKAYWHEP